MDIEQFAMLRNSIAHNKEVLSIDELENLLRQVDLTEKQQMWLDEVKYPFYNTNSKLGLNTMCTNCSGSGNCYSRKMGYCENSRVGETNHCYSVAQTLGFKDVIAKETIEEINFAKLTSNELLEQALGFCENRKIHFNRIDARGEIKNIQTFRKANLFAQGLNQEKGILSFGFTHNKGLDIDELLNSSIVMTFSYNTGRNDCKHSVIAWKWSNKYLDNSKYIICGGECKTCPYCKDKNELRTVVFIPHGCGLDGWKTAPKGLKQYLIDTAKADNDLFLKGKPYYQIRNLSSFKI